MIIPDINLLVHAYDGSSQFHAKAKNWLSKILDGQEVVGFPIVSLLGFAHIAALAIEHQGIVHSNDDDFKRFEKVRCFNRLI